MGTPEVMYNESGEKTWECTLSSYGKVRNFKGEWKGDCPFRYQGQYEDAETGLYYNRFRYYSPDEGMYISQDPIRLLGGHTLYNYVHNPYFWIDKYGCKAEEHNITSHGSQPSPRSPYQSHHVVQDEWAKNQGYENYSSSKAPSILLNATARDENKHAIITNRQNTRRDERVAQGLDKWSTTLEQEIEYMKGDLRAAGVPEDKIQEAEEEARKYFASCKKKE